MKVIVIGAGVVGASAAYRMSQAGAEVLVLEAVRPGAGTSGISYAWTNAHRKPPRPYHDLNANGMAVHRELRDEFGNAAWWHGGGSLEWVLPEELDAQKANIEQLRGWGYRAEWILLPGRSRSWNPTSTSRCLATPPAPISPTKAGWTRSCIYMRC